MGLRGLCPALGTILVTAAAVLLIFAHIGQIRVNQVVPRHIRIIEISNSGLSAAVGALAGGGDLTQIYGDVNQARGSYEPASGLRTEYTRGLWARCGGYGGPSDLQFCTKAGFAQEFQPVAQTYTRDVPAEQAQGVTSILPSGTFTADSYLGKFSKAAFYLIFIGSILTGITMLVGLIAHRFAFLFGALTALLAFLLVGVGAAIYTAIIYRARSSINGATVGDGVPLGITVNYGNGLWLIWGATVALFLSILPYLLGCCTGRGSSSKEEYY